MKKYIIAISTLIIPVTVLAQEQGFENVSGLAEGLQNVINILIPVVFSLGLLAFFWGLVKYIFVSGDEEAKKQGKNIMVGGIIALFVAASIWGIITFIQEAFGINDSDSNNPWPENILPDDFDNPDLPGPPVIEV